MASHFHNINTFPSLNNICFVCIGEFVPKRYLCAKYNFIIQLIHFLTLHVEHTRRFYLWKGRTNVRMVTTLYSQRNIRIQAYIMKSKVQLEVYQPYDPQGVEWRHIVSANSLTPTSAARHFTEVGGETLHIISWIYLEWTGMDSLV